MMPIEYYTKRPAEQIPKPQNFPVKLKILAPNTFLTEKAVQALKTVFKQDGIEVDFFLGKGKQLHEPASKGDFDLALLPFEGMVRDPDAFLFLVTPDAPIISFFKLPTKNEIADLNTLKFTQDKNHRLKEYVKVISKIENEIF